jgi:DNA-binding MarR family transcriptional regulator
MSANELLSRDVVMSRVLAGFDAFMHRMMSTHAPEFIEVGMTMSQAKVLYLVHVAGELRMSELSARLGVTLSTTSGLVERLVESGFLARHDDPADRRQVVLAITDNGIAQLDRLRELNAYHLGAMLARVRDEDLLVIERAIQVMTTAADDLVHPPTGADGRPPSPSTRKDVS